MPLRALTLLLLLAAPSFASAALGVVHRCDGEVRISLQVGCCCDHRCDDPASTEAQVLSRSCCESPSLGVNTTAFVSREGERARPDQ